MTGTTAESKSHDAPQKFTGVEWPEHEPDATVPPMTWSLMGRFFAVPFLIISIIVTGAILVVFLFGGPAAPESHSVDELLDGIESITWRRTAGMLLPQEKELLQRGIELSVRLEQKDREFTPEDLDKITARLVNMVEKQLLAGQAPDTSIPDPDEAAARLRHMEFMIHALGRTQRSEAIAVLAKIVRLNHEPYVAVALQELGNLHELPEARATVGDITKLLSRAPRPETAMVAATALSVLATPDDREAIESLKSLMFANEGEVAWSAAMALARLGEPSGRTVLLDMLDRKFWEGGKRYQVVDEKGVVRRYPMPPQRVEALLIAAMEAASHLNDPGLWEAIETLKSDPIPNVRLKAAEIASRRVASAASG